MNDWRDLSRLPKSEEYWQQLGARVEAAALPHLAQSGNDKWLWRGGWAAVVAMAAGVVLMLASDPAPRNTSGLLVAPRDPVAVRMMNSADPPSLLEMMPLAQLETR